MTQLDPAEIIKLAEVSAVKAAWDLWQEARQGAASGLSAGGSHFGRIAVEQAKAAWIEALREAQRR